MGQIVFQKAIKRFWMQTIVSNESAMVFNRGKFLVNKQENDRTANVPMNALVKNMITDMGKLGYFP
jgi:hypothetical protein